MADESRSQPDAPHCHQATPHAPSWLDFPHGTCPRTCDVIGELDCFSFSHPSARHVHSYAPRPHVQVDVAHIFVLDVNTTRSVSTCSVQQDGLVENRPYLACSAHYQGHQHDGSQHPHPPRESRDPCCGLLTHGPPPGGERHSVRRFPHDLRAQKVLLVRPSPMGSACSPRTEERSGAELA